MKIIKNIVISMLTGANIATVLLMLAVGYSDRISPAQIAMVGCVGMALPLFMLANLLFLLLWVAVKWKRLWIPVAGFAMAWQPISTYLPMNVRHEAPPTAISVVSYNVCGYGGNFKYDQGLDTVASYLQRINADIVCIQEDKSDKFDPVGRFRQMYAYNDTVHINPNSRIINVIGIHTRFPILRRERIDYQSATNGSMAYFLQIGADTVIVINNHLESTHLTADDRSRYKDVLKGRMERDSVSEEATHLFDKLNEGAAIRALQADALHRYIASHSQYPTIVCGDFNDTPISYTRRTVAKGLTDCFVETGRGLGLSYNQKGFNFRIDHILCSEHFAPKKCFVDGKMDASDHYPLLCWLEKVEKP